MLKKDNFNKVLEVFFDNPLPEGIGFQLREISRLITLAPKSVKLYLEKLLQAKLIIQKKHRIHKFPVYYSNYDNTYFKFLKRLNMLRRIKESGILEYISNMCAPDVIILFGSASKGEDLANSDVDLYVQSNQTKLNLSKFEKKIKRKINTFFESDFNKLSQELKNNIINGDKLNGYLRVSCSK